MVKVTKEDTSDAQLVRAARSGDKRAFVDIVGRYQGLVTSVTLAVLNDFAASEDAAQEAFVIAWQKISRLKDPEKLRPWLAQIARNIAITHVRRLKENVSLESVTLVDEKLRPDQIAVDREERATVISALDSLPEKIRLPLVLFYREEKSVRVVSETLGLTEDVIKKRLAKGREMLRGKVSDLVDSVLLRTSPGAVFTTATAGLIGAMLKPTAMAATAFSAKPITTTAATMTVSKLSFTAAIVTAFCLPAGYTARTLMTHEEPPVVQKVVPVVEDRSGIITAPPSAIVMAWRELLKSVNHDPAAFPDLYRTIQGNDSALRRRAFESLLIAKWVELDPARGFAFFQEEDRPEWQRDFLFDEWLKRDGDGAIDALLASGPGWEKNLPKYLITIGKLAPHRLTEIVSQVPMKYCGPWMGHAFKAYFESDPEEALRAAESLVGVRKEKALIGISWGKVKVDSYAAIQWAQSLKDRRMRQSVFRSTIHNLSFKDPMGALAYISHPLAGIGSDGVDSFGNELLKKAAEVDFDAALAWVKKNPTTTAAGGLSKEVSKRLEEDPIALMSQLEREGILLPMLVAFSTQKSLHDEAETRAAVWRWLLDPERSGEAKWLRKLMIEKTKITEPREIMNLVEQLPVGREREKMVSQMAGKIVSNLNLDPFATADPFAEADLGPQYLKDVGLIIESSLEEWKKPLIKETLDKISATHYASKGWMDFWTDYLGGLKAGDSMELVSRLATGFANVPSEQKNSLSFHFSTQGVEHGPVNLETAQAWLEKSSFGAEDQAEILRNLEKHAVKTR